MVMAVETKIEWADHTANFWEGCTQISPACDFCYAKTRAERYGTVEWNGPPRRVAAGVKVVRAAQRLAQETGVKQFVFVNSLSDFFDNQALPAWRLDALQDFELAPDCIFLLLTKRIGNVEPMMRGLGYPFMPKNIWLGITVPNQPEADRDIPKLLAAKAALKIPRVFLSIEPMLGPIDLDRGGFTFLRKLTSPTGKKYEKVDWVICGGESGRHARPMHPDWARSLRDQCAAAGVPFFFKQWGEWRQSRHDDPNRFGLERDEAMIAPSGKWGQCNLEESGSLRVKRYGKTRAGRMLDGVEHNGRPPA